MKNTGSTMNVDDMSPSTDCAMVPFGGFTYDPSLSEFAAPAKTYWQDHRAENFDFIATGALVFDTTHPEPRVLLIQRAATDTHPNKWEVAGGACDAQDPSILYSVARELYEETGLIAKHIRAQIGEKQTFTSSKGRWIWKVCFWVKVVEGGEVRLAESEHQDFWWATEREVRGGEVKGKGSMDFTSQQQRGVILEGFRYLRAICEFV